MTGLWQIISGTKRTGKVDARPITAAKPKAANKPRLSRSGGYVHGGVTLSDSAITVQKIIGEAQEKFDELDTEGAGLLLFTHHSLRFGSLLAQGCSAARIK